MNIYIFVIHWFYCLVINISIKVDKYVKKTLYIMLKLPKMTMYRQYFYFFIIH